MTVKVVWIVDDKTNRIERRIETQLTGRNYDTMMLGMYRRVDLERFSIIEDEADLRARGIEP